MTNVWSVWTSSEYQDFTSQETRRFCMAPKQKFWIPEKGQVFYNCSDGTPSFYTLKGDQPGAQGCIIPHICDSGNFDI